MTRAGSPASSSHSGCRKSSQRAGGPREASAGSFIDQQRKAHGGAEPRPRRDLPRDTRFVPGCRCWATSPSRFRRPIRTWSTGRSRPTRQQVSGDGRLSPPSQQSRPTFRWHEAASESRGRSPSSPDPAGQPAFGGARRADPGTIRDGLLKRFARSHAPDRVRDHATWTKPSCWPTASS